MGKTLNKDADCRKKLGYQGKPGHFLYEMLIRGAVRGDYQGNDELLYIKFPWLVDGNNEFGYIYMNDDVFVAQQESVDLLIEALAMYRKREIVFRRADRKLPEAIAENNKKALERLIPERLPEDNNCDTIKKRTRHL